MLYFKFLPYVKMLKEKQLKREILETCTGSITQSLGSLCAHTIKQLSLANEPLTMDVVNQHWHFYKPRPTRSDSPEAR